MKIISPDARGQIDGTIHKNIFDHLDHGLPVTLLPVSYQPNFEFKPPQITGTYVIIDLMEPCNNQSEYDKFWAWTKENPPALHFKRELLKQDVSETLKPIEFPCVYEPKKSHDREQFNARKFDVLFFWGYSSATRPLLQADIWRGMARDGLSVLSNWDQIEGIDQIPADQLGPLWLSVYTPHWKRKPMSEILPIMAQSKVTVAMPGNDSKTFRHGEVVDSILATQITDRAWSYPWHVNNSIQLVQNNEFNGLLQATQSSDLYDLYSNCCENMTNYFAPRYAKNYVEAEIRKII
jgi:hypothetical protein